MCYTQGVFLGAPGDSGNIIQRLKDDREVGHDSWPMLGRLPEYSESMVSKK